MNKLDQICADKLTHIQSMRQSMPLSALELKIADGDKVRPFQAAIYEEFLDGRPALIAEIKKASPSGGMIRADFDPALLAETYEAAGATCLSVLTDAPWFQGRDVDLVAARAACDLPVLRKDFMLDPYQVAESRALGADCILLIMAALTDAAAGELLDAARHYGMDVLVEVHDMSELDRAIDLGSPMIGVNSRNLKTLETSLDTAVDLAAYLPAKIVRIAESGIKSAAEIGRLRHAGYQGFLVGESLLRQDDLAGAVTALLSGA